MKKTQCKVTAICNQKGGVTKTTTTANLGIGLAMQGRKVLLVDIDPQADLTASLGWKDTDSLPITLANLMEKTINDEEVNPKLAILNHNEGVDLIPASLELSGVDVSLVNAMSREFALRSCLESLKQDYDHIIIDCPPSLLRNIFPRN
jgi:chromosome partitioning protein